MFHEFLSTVELYAYNFIKKLFIISVSSDCQIAQLLPFFSFEEMDWKKILKKTNVKSNLKDYKSVVVFDKILTDIWANEKRLFFFNAMGGILHFEHRSFVATIASTAGQLLPVGLICLGCCVAWKQAQ